MGVDRPSGKNCYIKFVQLYQNVKQKVEHNQQMWAQYKILTVPAVTGKMFPPFFDQYSLPGSTRPKNVFLFFLIFFLHRGRLLYMFAFFVLLLFFLLFPRKALSYIVLRYLSLMLGSPYFHLRSGRLKIAKSVVSRLGLSLERVSFTQS